MFIIDGKAWVSDGNDGFVLYPESDAEIEIYEIIRKELINNSNYSNHPIYFRSDDSMSNYENYQYPNFDATTN